MGSRIAWAGLVLGVLVATAWLWLGREVPEQLTAPAPSVVEGSPERQPASTADGIEASRPVALPLVRTATQVPTPKPATTTTATSEPAPEANPGTWTLWGYVRNKASGSPCPGYRVIGTGGVAATCNGNGAFEMELPAGRMNLGEYHTFYVYSPEGACVATRRLVVEPGLVLYADRPSVLSGHVVDPGGQPAAVESVVVHNRDRGPFVTGLVDQIDGEFRVAASERDTGYETLELVFSAGDAEFSVLCPTAALKRAEGATVVIDLCRVRFRATLSDESPAADVQLSVYPRRQGRRRPDRIGGLRPDDSGEIEVIVERDLQSLTVEASAPGFATWVETRSTPPCGQVWPLPLQELRAEDVVSGLVLSSDGRPLAAHFVRLTPGLDDPDLRDALDGELVLTGEDGAFSIPLARGRPAWIEASSGNGSQVVRREVGGGQRNVELRFAEVQHVVLSLTDYAGHRPKVNRPQSHFRLIADDGKSRSGTGTLSTIDLGELPVGRYWVGVFAGAPPLYAGLEFEVVPGRELALDAVLHPAFSATGRIVDERGDPVSGVSVRLVDAPWPSSEGSAPFAFTTRADGSYHVFLADRGQAEIEFSMRGRRPLRVTVQADTDATWTLP